MEEVWKDINLASLHDHHSSKETPNPHFILQDFLARPFTKDRVLTCSANRETTPYAGPPATVLSLNSSPVCDFFDNSDPMIRSNSGLQTSGPISNLPSFDSAFEALASSPGLASFGKKRAQESDNDCGDRRFKRMIKNRESAARSRARKQAYTNELELEVANLVEENTRLRIQQEQLRTAAAGAQLSKKRTLQRTSTAPF